MGNQLTNICSGACTCIFPENEELQETQIVQLADKYPHFPKDILDDIDNHFNILYNNREDIDDKLKTISLNITKVNSSLSQNKQDLNVQFKEFIQTQNKTISDMNNHINNANKDYDDKINSLKEQINTIVAVNESFHSKIEGIDNTMTGIISNDWNVLDSENENVDENENEDDVNTTVSSEIKNEPENKEKND
jgi:hypothetical protein